MQDTASLQNLNDIVMPAAVPWWPPAPGWYLAASVVMVAVIAWAWLAWRSWRGNRYRRRALIELQDIRGQEGETLEQLPALLKRTALSAWPRESVAALSGASWHRFLDASAGADRFEEGAGVLLDRLAYGSGLSRSEQEQLLDASEYWMRNHRIPGKGKPS